MLPENSAEVTPAATDKTKPFSVQEAAWNAAAEVRAGILTGNGAHAAKMLDWLLTNLYHPSFRQRPDLTPEEYRLLGENLGLPDPATTARPSAVETAQLEAVFQHLYNDDYHDPTDDYKCGVNHERKSNNRLLVEAAATLGLSLPVLP